MTGSNMYTLWPLDEYSNSYRFVTGRNPGILCHRIRQQECAPERPTNFGDLLHPHCYDGTMSPHFDEVLSDLRANPEKKWGFVIFRCTYGDDAGWERMIRRLKTQAKISLDMEGASDLFPRIDWEAQENPAWDEVGPKFIKQRFVEWKNANFHDGGGGPRSYGCIMIDKQSLDTLQHEHMPSEDEFDMHGRSWVWMISSSKGERTTRVGTSYVMPRTWLMLNRRGWSAIYDDGAVATP
ncbi:hypothetical protein OPT61_g833 [Boeremia exigua]|uniref:Uncharacterized protein n=1 Tax=Boeremia exigua TaxID=749465 RepID=A0ACC2ISS1_9PLEO|nr:hypothetical protein OPT61_g833 [Boeremia exigua]